MNKLKLYHTPGTCAMSVHIALEEAGADYEAQKVDFSKNEQKSPEYLAVNPKGRVPTLVTKDGILTETPALLLYVAQCYPESNLAPLKDPFKLAQVQSVNSYLCSTMHVAHAHRMRGSRWADDEQAHESMRKKVPQNMSDCCAMIEETMLKSPYVLGEQFSISDIYLYTICTWLPGDGVDISNYSKLFKHFKLIGERPSVKRVLAKA